MSAVIEEPVGLEQLSRDIRNAAATLDVKQARFLVDLYYTMQEHRIALAGQQRSMAKLEEPHEAIAFFQRQMGELERQAQTVLDVWSAQQPLGQWARAQKGIGPVLAAALLAHIDPHRAPTVGHVWRFAGLDPTVTWERGQKRPWNAELKVICWKIGESFMKVSSRDDAFYGKLYVQRKQFEVERNEQVNAVPAGAVIGKPSAPPADGAPLAGTFVLDGKAYTCYQIEHSWFYGGNAQAAAETLSRKRIGKETIAYKAYSHGRIPDAQILARAKRYAMKLFLAHYLEVGRRQLGLEVPLPYPIQYQGHIHYIPPPEG
jgi:hypothetical protein